MFDRLLLECSVLSLNTLASIQEVACLSYMTQILLTGTLGLSQTNKNIAIFFICDLPAGYNKF